MVTTRRIGLLLAAPAVLRPLCALFKRWRSTRLSASLREGRRSEAVNFERGTLPRKKPSDRADYVICSTI